MVPAFFYAHTVPDYQGVRNAGKDIFQHGK